MTGTTRKFEIGDRVYHYRDVGTVERITAKNRVKVKWGDGSESYHPEDMLISESAAIQSSVPRLFLREITEEEAKTEWTALLVHGKTMRIAWYSDDDGCWYSEADGYIKPEVATRFYALPTPTEGEAE